MVMMRAKLAFLLTAHWSLSLASCPCTGSIDLTKGWDELYGAWLIETSSSTIIRGTEDALSMTGGASCPSSIQWNVYPMSTYPATGN